MQVLNSIFLKNITGGKNSLRRIAPENPECYFYATARFGDIQSYDCNEINYLLSQYGDCVILAKTKEGLTVDNTNTPAYEHIMSCMFGGVLKIFFGEGKPLKKKLF